MTGKTANEENLWKGWRRINYRIHILRTFHESCPAVYHAQLRSKQWEDPWQNLLDCLLYWDCWHTFPDTNPCVWGHRPAPSNQKRARRGLLHIFSCVHTDTERHRKNGINRLIGLHLLKNRDNDIRQFWQ